MNSFYKLLSVCAFTTITSCASENKMSIASETIYRPLEKVDLSSYEPVQLRKGQNPNIVLGLAVSGGGSRAQYFGLGVLMGLEDINSKTNNFLNEIDYFSTVSGGGFAIAYYLTLKNAGVLQDFPSLMDFWKSDERKNNLQEFLFKDAKALSILKLSRYEKNKIRNPYPEMIDYELLQYGKSYKGQPIKRLYLRDFFIPKNSSIPIKLPMFVANGTIYNNGERLPFMPHIINALNINGSLLPGEPFNINNGYGLPLTYAVTGSAAFPGVLPMLKFSIDQDPMNVIRVIDGGAVDNLGYTTLFELLNSDNSKPEAKKMLIVDCGGFGNDIQKQPEGRVKIKSLLKKSLLFSVDIPLLYSDNSIKYIESYYSIPDDNVKRIGFSTIKSQVKLLEAAADKKSLNDLQDLKTKIQNESLGWEDIYRDFAGSLIFSGYSAQNLSEVPTEVFKRLGLRETFELFELAAQVETKIKIYPWEKEILILAGRYSVYLRKEELAKLVN